jgi:hypothetical protein
MFISKVAWANDDGTITLSQREGDDGYQPNLTDQQNDLILLETSGIYGDNLIVEFTRPLNVMSKKGKTIKNKQTFGYAYSTLNPGDNDKGAYLQRHDYNGNVILNFKKGSSGLAWYDKLIIAHGKCRKI